MHRREPTTLVTLGSSGAVTYQRFANDELLAEDHLDASMFTPERHPLLVLRDGDGNDAWPRKPKRGSRKRR